MAQQVRGHPRQVDAGIEPAAEDNLVQVRRRAARAVQAVFSAFGFPVVSDEEVGSPEGKRIIADHIGESAMYGGAIASRGLAG